MGSDSIIWVRSLLAVYRQAVVDVTGEGTDLAVRPRVAEELGRFQASIAAHEELESLWHEGFGGSEAGVRAALAPLIEAALLCNPDSPMRALVEFAAEEMAAVFDEE